MALASSEPVIGDTDVDLGTKADIFCPNGGDFYICGLSWTQFIGCCTSDPCGLNYGICPQRNLRPMGYEPLHRYRTVLQQCEPSVDFHTCNIGNWTFYGCCGGSFACARGEDCENDEIRPTTLSGHQGSELFFDTPEPITTPDVSTDWSVQEEGTGLLGFGAVVGIAIGVMLLVLFAIGFLAWKRGLVANKMLPRELTDICSSSKFGRISYKMAPVDQAVDEQHPPISKSTMLNNVSDSNRERAQSANIAVVGGSSEWPPDPQPLRQKDIAWLGKCIWDTVLTLAPIVFLGKRSLAAVFLSFRLIRELNLVLAILVLRIEGEAPSSYGRSLTELVRLSPTIFPIVFAAIATRFFKSLARWRLELPNGIKLGFLDQLFGSQSFAGAFERLIFGRSHIAAGVFIVLTWAMSPLGGQSASRILFTGEHRVTSKSTVWYVDPGYQFSYFYVSALADTVKATAFSQYTLNMMSSPEQRRSDRDFWGLPRIPQWPEGRASDEPYEIDKKHFESGDEDYASLLGIKVQGLDFNDRAARYDFSVQTSYVDLDCSALRTEENRTVIDEYFFLRSTHWNSVDVEPLFKYTNTSFAVDIRPVDRRQNLTNATKTPELHMVFVSQGAIKNEETTKYFANRLFGFDCAMETVYLETDIRCPSPSTCSAWQQRRVNPPDGTSSQFPHMMREHLGGVTKGISLWSAAAGSADYTRASATENFIAGDLHVFNNQPRRDWTDIDIKRFSRRLTTAFNTYWDSTKGPLEFSVIDVTSRALPDRNVLVGRPDEMHDYYNATQAIARPNRVYLADRVWVGFLIAITMLLQILAILGHVLLLLIKGPDVLGFASSVTRDNKYIPLPPAGSSLGGPERAKLLHDMRLQLADIRGEDDVGYLAFRAVSRDEPLREPRMDQEAQDLSRNSPELGQGGDLSETSKQTSKEAGSPHERVRGGDQTWRPLDLHRLYK